MHLPFRVTTVLGTVGCLLAITACGGTEIGQPMAPGSQLAVSITQKTDTLVPGATRQLFAMVTDAYGAGGRGIPAGRRARAGDRRWREDHCLARAGSA